MSTQGQGTSPPAHATTPAVDAAVARPTGGGAPSLSARAGTFVMHALLGIAACGLLLGFFLPWISLGDAVAVSGLALATSSGSAIEQVAGPSRMMLYLVPLAGVLLLFASIRGLRISPWLGIASGGLILAAGFYVLVRTFLNTTGVGMWMVVGSALLATGVGLVAYGRTSR